MNSKCSAKQEEKSSRPAWQRQTAHRSVHKKGNSNNWVDCSPSSSIQSRFSTLLLPSFCALKDTFRGIRSADDDELKHSLHQELRFFSKGFYATGIERLMQRWKSVLLMKGTLWESNHYFVKYVPMICVNFTIVVAMISKKEIGDFTFVPLLLRLFLILYNFMYSTPFWRRGWEWVGAIIPPPSCACIGITLQCDVDKNAGNSSSSV